MFFENRSSRFERYNDERNGDLGFVVIGFGYFVFVCCISWWDCMVNELCEGFLRGCREWLFVVGEGVCWMVWVLYVNVVGDVFGC